MPIEPTGYREQLQVLMDAYPGRQCIFINEAAKALGVHVQTIYTATRNVENPFPYKKIENRMVVPLAALARWLTKE